MVRNPLLLELLDRGFVSDCTDIEGLDARLELGPTRVYIGFDPTADSLHVGSLMPLFAARLIQKHGHVPVLLIGGATGMIGDPSGRSTERNLLDEDALDHNRAALEGQIRSLVPPCGASPMVVDNRDWIGSMSAIELLRDVGRHFPVNSMLARDSVKLRRESEAGLTFTEFAYQLLQAFDFWWLRAHLDVEVQMGGSDQWGNITAGTDFMRRKDGSTGFGLVWPLLQKADGTKFGKTVDGNVWLDPNRTSAFEFWQFWFNTEDADVETMLLRFTDIEPHVIRELVAEHRIDPSQRSAQRALADNVTAWVRGTDAVVRVARVSELLFGDGDDLGPRDFAALEQEIGAVSVPREILIGMDAIDLAVVSGLSSSRGEARRLVAGRGLRIGSRVAMLVDAVEEADLRDSWLLVRKGRRRPAILRALT